MHSSSVETSAQFRLSRASGIEAAGAAIVQWSIILLVVFFGGLKWTAAEADAIAPFIVNSPVLRWVGLVFGRQTLGEQHD